MQRHRLEKIVVSTGVGKLRQNPKFEDSVLPGLLSDLGAITGQKPALKGAKKSIATFKTRAGDTVGLSVTLRGRRMKDFLSRLINTALPRVRDFKGISLDSFDSRGNLSIGIKEHTVFPEINTEKTTTVFGIQITFVGNTKTVEEGKELFSQLGIPFKKS